MTAYITPAAYRKIAEFVEYIQANQIINMSGAIENTLSM
jgi:hypothetical protein